MSTNSLEVTQDGARVNAVRRWLGVPVSRKSMPRSGLARFRKKSSMKTQSGGRHVIYCAIERLDEHADGMVVGEGFRGESGARATMRIIAAELGLRLHADSSRGRPEEPVYGEDVLTADS